MARFDSRTTREIKVNTLTSDSERCNDVRPGARAICKECEADTTRDAKRSKRLVSQRLRYR